MEAKFDRDPAADLAMCETAKRRGAFITIDVTEAYIREVQRLRTRLLTAAGDDLCRLTQEEIKGMSLGTVKIPPKEEFLASCERFHSQVAGSSGVMNDCLTLAQLVAENERLRMALEKIAKQVYRNDKMELEAVQYVARAALARAERTGDESLEGG